jgi:hypothetical protein
MMREAALHYVRRGWSVFPISSVSKKPLLDWYEYQTRQPTEQEIHQWWQKYPSAGVGIVTGKVSNLVVLDVDPKHGADPNYIYKTFPTNIVARTGGGGGHFYYKYPDNEEIHNSVGKKDGRQTGYDIRAEGGYVVAPPSLHPSGRRYEWLETGKKPSQLPPKLLEMAQPKRDLNGAATSKEPWLADALRGVGEGARDDTAARLAGYYLSKNMGADVVLETLRNWNKNNEPPLPDADLEKVVESVQKTRARQPKKLQNQGRDTEDEEQDLLRLVSLHQYMSQYGETDVAWAVEEWLPDATIAMMVSPPGTYKTWALIDLAVSIATGTPFLGTAKVNRAGPVLVYQQEDFHGQMAQRISTIMGGRFEIGWHGDTGKNITVTLPPSPPIYLHDNRELRFDNKEIMDILEARIAQLRPVAVIVDPLYTAAPMDDYMAKAVPHMMRLKKIRDKYGCSFIIAHHTGKRSDKEKSQREDIWGSQFLNAFLETGWQIRPKSQNTALIRRHFKVTKDIEEMMLTFDIATNITPTRYVATLGSIEGKDDREVAIIDALDTHGPMKASELARTLKISKSQVSRHTRGLLASGALRLGRDGRLRSPEHFNVAEIED